MNAGPGSAVDVECSADVSRLVEASGFPDVECSLEVSLAVDVSLSLGVSWSADVSLSLDVSWSADVSLSLDVSWSADVSRSLGVSWSADVSLSLDVSWSADVSRFADTESTVDTSRADADVTVRWSTVVLSAHMDAMFSSKVINVTSVHEPPCLRMTWSALALRRRLPQCLLAICSQKRDFYSARLITHTAPVQNALQ